MRKPLSRRSPQTAYDELPEYYENEDVAHALAHVRFMQWFFQTGAEADDKLHITYMEMLNEVLAPYALDLALSLIALEKFIDEK